MCEDGFAQVKYKWARGFTAAISQDDDAWFQWNAASSCLTDQGSY